MSYKVTAADIGAVQLNETDTVRSVLQNIAIILSTRQGTCPLYPGFGAGPLRRSAGCGFLPVRRVFIDNFNVIDYGK